MQCTSSRRAVARAAHEALEQHLQRSSLQRSFHLLPSTIPAPATSPTASRQRATRAPLLLLLLQHQQCRYSSYSTTAALSRYRDSTSCRAAEPSYQRRRRTRTSSSAIRAFTASAQSPRRQHAILNPRMDEEGNEMSIEITSRAADRLSQIMQKDDNPALALRVSVEAGGCHGFQYLMSLIDMSKVSPAEDTVFEGERGARVVLDEPSLELLKGSKVDYTMELIGSQFKIVDNPYATSSCGCGTSFDIKA